MTGGLLPSLECVLFTQAEFSTTSKQPLVVVMYRCVPSDPWINSTIDPMEGMSNVWVICTIPYRTIHTLEQMIYPNNTHR